MFKRDKQATEAAGFVDRDSYISHRVHPGTDHQCQYLKGDDVEQIRRKIFDRDRHRCQLKLVCTGVRVLPFEGDIYTRGHLEHEKGGYGAQRCFCMENLRIACYACHVIKHGRYPRFGEKHGESAGG